MPSRRPLALALAAAMLCAPLGACRDAPTAFGPSPATARAHADDFFRGLALRFVNVQRHPKFAAGRARLGRYALSPSRLVDDTVVWTSAPAPRVRVLELEGRPTGSAYQFTPRAGARLPEQPGESRHTMRLQRLDDDEFQWLTVVEQAVGPATPGEVAAATGGWLRALQRPERDIRADLRTALPRTSAAMGRLFVLDSVRSTPLADGSTVVDLRVRVDSRRVRPTMPALADYVDKYVKPGRWDVQLTDGRGARWLESRAANTVVTFRFRTRAGQLLALDGPARPMPDSLLLQLEVHEKFLIFDVGVSRLVGDFVTVRSPTARGWSMRFRRAPRWHLPFAVRHLISGALDRPFQQDGILFSLVLRDGGAQTLLVRHLDVAVKESAIVRWLGGLGSKAMEDFAGRAELDENRFTAEALLALRADVTAALGGTASGP